MRGVGSLVMVVAAAVVASCGGAPDPPLRPPAPTPVRLAFADAAALRAFLRWSPDARPLVVAHRGGPAPGYPENGLATFERAHRLGADVLEVDLRPTADDHLVAFHDENLGRLTDGRGPLSGATLATLRTLRLRDDEGTLTGHRVASLDEVADWARGRALLALDAKGTLPAARIARDVERLGLAAFAFVLAYDLDAAKRWHELAPELVVCAAVADLGAAQTLLDSVVPVENLVVWQGQDVPLSLYDLAHGRGCRVMGAAFGPVDRYARKEGYGVYVEWFRRGIDLINTDDVVAVARARDEVEAERRARPR